jgi:hypothetical protein
MDHTEIASIVRRDLTQLMIAMRIPTAHMASHLDQIVPGIVAGIESGAVKLEDGRLTFKKLASARVGPRGELN